MYDLPVSYYFCSSFHVLCFIVLPSTTYVASHQVFASAPNRSSPGPATERPAQLLVHDDTRKEIMKESEDWDFMKLHETPKCFTQSYSLLGDALDPRSEHGRRCFAGLLYKLKDWLSEPCSLHDQTVLAARDTRREG